MNEKKNNSGLIAVIIILVVVIIGLGCSLGYVLLKDNNKNINSKENKTEEKTDKVAYDLEEAKKLVDRYAKIISFLNVFNDGITDEAKVYIAYNAVSNSKIDDIQNCAELYEENYMENYNGDQGGYDQYGHRIFCQEGYSEKVSYSDLNNSYKSLFGKNLNIEKTRYYKELFVLDYNSQVDSFITLASGTEGGYDQNYYGYGIKDAYTNDDNTLTVEVGYFVIELEWKDDYIPIMKFEPTNKIYEQSEIESENFDSIFFEENKDYTILYRFTFSLEDGNYVFTDMKKM